MKKKEYANFLKELGFVRCERGKYYRLKIYDNLFLEIDTEDSFASLVQIRKYRKRLNEKITKICLPNKLTKERLLKLLEVIK
jgi:hypothetical protein